MFCFALQAIYPSFQQLFDFWLQAIFPSFQLVFKWKISPLFQYFFGLQLHWCYPLFQFFSLIGNKTVFSNICCPCVLSNLSVVSNLISNGKSNRCFNNILAMHCERSICCFNSFVKWKIEPLFQQFFGLPL